MEIIKIAEQPLAETPRGVKGRALVDIPAVNVMNLLIAPGEKVAAHTTPVDVLFHVIEGQGSVTIGDETEKVSAGEIIISPANIPHALEADAWTTFNVLVIKTPNPKKMAGK